MEGLSSRHTHKQDRQYSRETDKSVTQRHIEIHTYKEREFLSFRNFQHQQHSSNENTNEHVSAQSSRERNFLLIFQNTFGLIIGLTFMIVLGCVIFGGSFELCTLILFKSRA